MEIVELNLNPSWAGLWCQYWRQSRSIDDGWGDSLGGARRLTVNYLKGNITFWIAYDNTRWRI